MLAWLLGSAALAGVFVEGDPTDWVTIGAAVGAAPFGGMVLADPGTYDEDLVLAQSVSIVGVGGAAVTTIHGGPYAAAVEIRPQVSATLRGVRIASDRGAAVRARDATRLVLDDVVVAGLHTADLTVGAAVDFVGEDLVVHGCSFVNNDVAGGTIHANGSTGRSVPANVFIDGSSFDDNTSSMSGCDLSTFYSDQITIVSSRFVGGSCHTVKIDAWLESISPVPGFTLLDSTIEGCNSIGAISVLTDLPASPVTLIGNRFLDNQTSFAIDVSGGTVVSTGDAMSGGQGAYLYLTGAVAEVVGGSFCGPGWYGALLTGQSFLDTTLRNSVFASDVPGSASVNLGDSNLENVTIMGARTGLAATGTATNVLYVGNGTAIDGPITDRYGMFWANGADAANGAILEDSVFADPGLPVFTDCATLDVTLPAGSPAIDAGDPAIADPDGSRSDIGATGGPLGGGWLDGDGDGAIGFVDCDDADPLVLFGAAETCNGYDDDCDGWIDEADPSVDRDALLEWWADADEDGYGSADSALRACEAPTGYVAAGVDDCDDLASGVHPGADELCDGVDEDCDGVSDEDPVGAVTWYVDADGDGAGDPASAQLGCPPAYAVLDGGDCDDADPARAQDCATAPPGDDGDDGQHDADVDPGCGCATQRFVGGPHPEGSAPFGAALTALAAAFARRRRISALALSRGGPALGLRPQG